MAKLSHIDQDNQPTMVDVSRKEPTDRTAHARTIVEFPAAVSDRLTDGDIQTAKGPVFVTAIIAGVMAVAASFAMIPILVRFGKRFHSDQ